MGEWCPLTAHSQGVSLVFHFSTWLQISLQAKDCTLNLNIKEIWSVLLYVGQIPWSFRRLAMNFRCSHMVADWNINIFIDFFFFYNSWPLLESIVTAIFHKGGSSKLFRGDFQAHMRYVLFKRKILCGVFL